MFITSTHFKVCIVKTSEEICLIMINILDLMMMNFGYENVAAIIYGR